MCSIYILYKGDLLESFTGYCTTNSTTVGYEQKVQESRNCSAPKAGCLNWSSVDPGTLKSRL